MALTRDFKATVQSRAAGDPAFRQALLVEAVECLFQGDADAGRATLRDYINATVGFEQLGAGIGISAKSLMRMLGRGGNPSLNNLTAILRYLSEHEGIELHAEATPREAEYA
jgi:DNA-binding phage protein